ncbi:hypothetical protein NLU13_8328 [Sarocladium strictum]|uniref:Extracellular membrane protein CFEM domain-containing protein n=1 Tax=Sarocladium strictum TaxID=5046 RepID=A0AA39GBH5_SARSR|nr:hypothetical protein NLU13_8328 [Sarocladium strictum]
MRLSGIISIALLAAGVAVAKNNDQWKNCNKCMAECLNNEDSRELSHCKNKWDDYCVFQSQQFHDGVTACVQQKCGPKCAHISEIYKHLSPDVKIGWDRLSPPDENIKGSRKGGRDLSPDEDQEDVHVVVAKRGLDREADARLMAESSLLAEKRDTDERSRGCGCGSSGPSGNSGERTKRESLSQRRKVNDFSPKCADVCLAKQVSEYAHLFRFDKKFGESICYDKTYIPSCCATLTDNDHEEVQKAQRWIGHFCKKYKGESVIEITGGLGGPDTDEAVKDFGKKKEKSCKEA